MAFGKGRFQCLLHPFRRTLCNLRSYRHGRHRRGCTCRYGAGSYRCRPFRCSRCPFHRSPCRLGYTRCPRGCASPFHRGSGFLSCLPTEHPCRRFCPLYSSSGTRIPPLYPGFHALCHAIRIWTPAILLPETGLCMPAALWPSVSQAGCPVCLLLHPPLCHACPGFPAPAPLCMGKLQVPSPCMAVSRLPVYPFYASSPNRIQRPSTCTLLPALFLFLTDHRWPSAHPSWTSPACVPPGPPSLPQHLLSAGCPGLTFLTFIRLPSCFTDASYSFPPVSPQAPSGPAVLSGISPPFDGNPY